jgi:hypothetical protein
MALLHGQISFTNATTSLSNTTHSGNCIGVVDMNGDGLDDMAKLHLGEIFQVEYQNSNGTFSLVDYGQIASESQWGMSLGDISNDGHKDLISGGSYDGVHYLRIASMGNSTLGDLNNGNMFMQCNNMADINNDGDLDFFACHDDAAPRQWINDGSGNLTYQALIDYTTTPNSDMSGNYGSVWSDFDNDGDVDLYIAKCRQGVNDQEDPRRWNRLFVNNGNGTYTDMAATYGVQVKYQSWTADFGDINNDGDMDLVITNHDHSIQLFENDGSGNFNEITTGSGLEITGFFLQSKFVDFDNDGFVDLLISGGIERLFRNDGDNTFSEMSNMFPAPKAMHGFATGDLNNDGFIDVFANYGSGYTTPDENHPDRLWLNNGNDNHWLSVRLQGVESNRDAVGARVTLIGPWGTQIREVRAGESYGIVTSFACHFGLGTETTIPTMIVRWPSGLEETFTNLEVDQTITVIEGVCLAPQTSITTPGASSLCTGGDPITLTASADGAISYTWSSGDPGSSISVSQPGTYSVTANFGGGCSSMSTFYVDLDPDETPTVEISGDTRLCEGGSVELSIASGNSPVWSNGGTDNSITVAESGDYSVTVQGACEAFTSEVIAVEVFDAPEAPEASDVTVNLGQQATLDATGDDVHWFDAAMGGTLVGTGNTYQTPALFSATSYWAADVITHEFTSIYGGRTDNSTTGGYHNNATFYLLFTVHEPMILRSVKVYANGAGNRPIAVVDQSDGSTVVSGTFMIPDGESRVDFDWILQPGSYGLRVESGNPQLWRDQQGSDPQYPYVMGDLATITSSTASGALATELYYFFYDWEVAAAPMTCESQRSEVHVTVNGVGIEDAVTSTINIWPNPADRTIFIEGANGTVEISDAIGRIIISDNDVSVAGIRSIDVSDLSPGQYLVKAARGDGFRMAKIIVR